MNFLLHILFGAAIVLAYVKIHAKKEQLTMSAWIQKNALAFVCSVLVVFMSMLVPKEALAGVMAWIGTPFVLAFVLKWGGTSLITNVLALIKKHVFGK